MKQEDTIVTMNFWKDKSRKLLDPELFSEKADALAQAILRERQGKDKINNPTQIRRFFDEILRIGGMLKMAPNSFEEHLPYLKMLNAKAAYAHGRELISTGFKGFIADSLMQIKDKDDFDAFASYFEAFLGFYKFYHKKAEQEGRRGGER